MSHTASERMENKSIQQRTAHIHRDYNIPGLPGKPRHGLRNRRPDPGKEIRHIPHAAITALHGRQLCRPTFRLITISEATSRTAFFKSPAVFNPLRKPAEEIRHPAFIIRKRPLKDIIRLFMVLCPPDTIQIFKAGYMIAKLPNLAALQSEYEALQAQKEALYADYGKLKKKVREYDIIKQNIDSILQADRQPERERGTERG